ncbi:MULTISPECIES: hypothetical protein [Pseudoalteromonas]|nr:MULTISPECIES: hypothetical protein [Pseudoalteromonas]NKC18409.1 hypothetical protein [Pseudoalteromonas galatheae]RXE85044.1 hypothetical protein DRB05_19030 [Pseudoalteromonas sp. A757]
MKHLFSSIILSVLFSGLTFASTDNTIVQTTEHGIKGVIQTHNDGKDQSPNLQSDSSPIQFSITNKMQGIVSASIQYKGNFYFLSLDQNKKLVKISGIDATKQPLVNTQALQTDIKDMLHHAKLNGSAIMKSQSTLDQQSKLVLLKFFEFLSTYPLGEAIEQEVTRDFSAQGWTDLCPYMGYSRTAVWDVNDSNVKTRSYIVGGHGFCAARCGAGCPMFGDGQYTQDCLNHDACADVEGEQLGVCSDEWSAASDDFWFSPDCTTSPSSLR